MRKTQWLCAPQLRLLRDFLADSLYDLQTGYFSKQAPVGFLEPPINFAALSGRRAYLEAVQRRYDQLQTAWLTPVEIFSPHYGAAIARYLAHHHTAANHPSPQPLVVYEIGGGSGTLAKDVLGWLRAHRPELYASCRYVCVEISPTLAEEQKRRVAGESGHAGVFSVERRDAAELAGWGPGPGMGNGASEQCFVVAMEVLDNLPHDRIWREGSGDAEWHETMVECTDSTRSNGKESAGSWKAREVLRPVEDERVRRCLAARDEIRNSGSGAGRRSNSGGGSERGGALGSTLLRTMQWAMGTAVGEVAFLPTGALKLFDTLHAVRPNHRLLFCDFDHLPETVIPGWNAPLVATTEGGVTVDHRTYLVQPGTADVFFPSDFELLRRAYEEAGRGLRQAHQLKARSFFEEWAAEEAAGTTTQDGYNPLLEDYTNTAFLIS